MKFEKYKTITCPYCDGVGFITKKDGEIYTCRHCDGAKVIPEHIPSEDGFYGGVYDEDDKEYVYLAKGKTFRDCHNKLFHYMVNTTSNFGVDLNRNSYLINVINGKVIMPAARISWSDEQKDLIDAIYTIG